MRRRLTILMEKNALEAHKIFQRLANKTQVRFPGRDDTEVIRNRLTHSYEVATSAEIIAASIAEQRGVSVDMIDHEGSVVICSLFHDGGHCPFGHDGQRLLDATFKDLGVTEGFCDNNNTLVVAEKNNIMLSEHTLASLIKYPDRLYPYQEAKYLPLLEKAINSDIEHFKTIGLTLDPAKRKRTIACDIMDEADRNTYICSDLSDYLCLGNDLPIKGLKKLAEECDLTYRFGELSNLLVIASSKDKSAIKTYFNTLKNRFNQNFSLTENGIEIIDHDLHAYREYLWDVEYRYYITPNRREKQHHDNMAMFSAYIEQVIKGGFTPSRTYRKLIEQETDPIEKLRLQRDMIAETTDWYVTRVQMMANIANTAPHEPLGKLDPAQSERIRSTLAQYHREELDPDTLG